MSVQQDFTQTKAADYTLTSDAAGSSCISADGFKAALFTYSEFLFDDRSLEGLSKKGRNVVIDTRRTAAFSAWQQHPLSKKALTKEELIEAILFCKKASRGIDLTDDEAVAVYEDWVILFQSYARKIFNKPENFSSARESYDLFAGVDPKQLADDTLEPN